jgi:hypothetical protein
MEYLIQFLTRMDISVLDFRGLLCAAQYFLCIFWYRKHCTIYMVIDTPIKLIKEFQSGNKHNILHGFLQIFVVESHSKQHKFCS